MDNTYIEYIAKVSIRHVSFIYKIGLNHHLLLAITPFLELHFRTEIYAKY